MFSARLICSDQACAVAHEVEAATVAELERMACDCGCVLEIVGWPDWMEPRRSVVIALPPRAEPAALRDAA